MKGAEERGLADRGSREDRDEPGRVISVETLGSESTSWYYTE